METFDFRDWCARYALSVEQAAKIFAVSRRTVIRWRNSARIPRPAAQLVRVIERQQAPWNASFSRSEHVGMMRLDPDWRDELFAPPGGRWQDYRSPAQRALARDLALRAEAYAAQRAQQRRAARLAAGRKAAATRARRAQLQEDAAGVRRGLSCRGCRRAD